MNLGKGYGAAQATGPARRGGEDYDCLTLGWQTCLPPHRRSGRWGVTGESPRLQVRQSTCVGWKGGRERVR